MAEFYQKWQKRDRRIFSKEILYLTVLTHFQRQRKTLTSFWIDPSCVCRIGVFVQLGELFPNWPNFLDALAGKQFRDLATLLRGVSLLVSNQDENLADPVGPTWLPPDARPVDGLQDFVRWATANGWQGIYTPAICPGYSPRILLQVALDAYSMSAVI